MSEHSLMILDGGLGTYLETEIGPDITQSTLWSTQAVVDHPDEIVKAHTAYLNAGARIIETATYQASFTSLIAAGLCSVTSQKTMMKAVELARQAKATFDLAGGRIFIALSLGPFGATLRPTQEFLGYYPPPYGPRSYSCSGPNAKDFERLDDEHKAVDALAQFHLERLLVYSSDLTTWDSIDYLAFETILLAREVIAIRKAMTLFVEFLSQTNRVLSKPWWISFVCPASPESTQENADKISILDLAGAALNDTFGGLLPSGIGINCTSLQQLPSLVAQLSETIVQYSPPADLYLVLYPNGGEYDNNSNCWLPRRDGDSDRWAAGFSDLLRSVVEDGQWKKVIAGGCCHTSPTHIEKLQQVTRNGVFRS